MGFKNFIAQRLHHYKYIIFIIVLAVMIAFLFWYSTASDDEFLAVVSFFEYYVNKSEALGVLIFLVLNSASVMLGPFTSFPLVPISVVVWGEFNTIILLLAGWLLGDVVAYYIGYYFSYPAVRYLVSAERLDSWISTVSERTNFYVLFLFRMAFPAEIGYAFGLIKYDLGKYLILTLIAEIPFAIILAYLGGAFINKHLATFLGLVIAVGVIIIAALYLFSRSSKKQH
ncbi:MAG: hypothetical protein COU46_02545 [Candidatus Niyogibacteria bacterium CG10_big_fil_rev_8_21_14_0_10_42_19]|uniref:VTT domain-containing protein n=1 Tax=Candidatus Niyogibacteria bacterium CG10_big_fil_rev_8_21_14_0_10_42_19 TaxID=1974725 RepID=A0A2H0TFA9_9BACT|nr:MAG: hypothetical protein COU46_02545 [Candidatus Niyogibacteria bacterium CG10_big_fil_rev_8_21_14_0_10_42_19]